MAGKKEDLPTDVVSVIYHCHACGAKNTYGRDYFAVSGTPSACEACTTPYIQDDRYHRLQTDTPDDLDAKKGALMGRRGVPARPQAKPEDPEEIKRSRIKALEDELNQLKDGDNGDGKPIRLGP